MRSSRTIALDCAEGGARRPHIRVEEIQMAAVQRFFLSIGDLSQARGENAELSFHGVSPESFANTLQAALREPSLWKRWKALQPDPDAVDPLLGASDANARV